MSTEPQSKLRPGLPGNAIKKEALPIAGEPLFQKNVNSAFIGTDLEQRLRTAGATSVAIVGLTTDHCCSTTARMAANLGFETWLLGDAMATFARRTPDGELIAADDIHRVELASLHDEFGEVLSTDAALARLDTA